VKFRAGLRKRLGVRLMASYNTVVHICRSSLTTIEATLQSYINGLDSGKTIRAISGMIYGTDSVLVLVVTDA
jgi:hypothetical protein